MSNPEHIPVNGDVVAEGPDQALAKLGDFLSRATAAARATSGYKAACGRSEFPVLSNLLYGEDNSTDQSDDSTIGSTTD